MKYTDRREYLYDPAVFGRADTATALRIHDEYIVKHASRMSKPQFLEVDRGFQKVDPLWNENTGGADAYSRTIDVACIVRFERSSWRLNSQGRAPSQNIRFWTSNLELQRLNYFPIPGDRIYWNGHRTEIIDIELSPELYWQQTNVWLGIVYVAAIVPEGDKRPQINPAIVVGVSSPENTSPTPVVPKDYLRGSTFVTDNA